MGEALPRRSVETIVIGAGQAGLIVSFLLRQAAAEHVVLDRRATLGGGWQDRWDGFRLVSPNWTASVPGFAYAGAHPDGFMRRDELVEHFRRYARAIDAPVELDTDVTRLQELQDGAARFRLTTSRGTFDARNVVVAGGPFQVPHIPAMANGFDPGIAQIHSHAYRNPGALPPGGVLLVGSGQTGVQLAEELLLAGRAVTIAVGRCGRVPRRYRDRDVFWWLRQLAVSGPSVGLRLPHVSELPDARARFACNPQLSGHGEPPRDVNLRSMAQGGLRVVGRLAGAEGPRARFAPGLGDTLRFADAFFADRLQGRFDAYAERTGAGLPPGEFEQVAFEPPEVPELDLAAEGISTVLWTSGYRPAFGWIEPPVLDDLGLPRQQDGLTDVPGLAFIGTPWLVDMGSANLVGIARDAEMLVSRLLDQ